MTTTIQESYAALIHTLRDLEKVLGPAVAAQYSPPPGGTGEVARNGIPNPTLDTVIDPRRLGLSEAVRATSSTLARITGELTEQRIILAAALTRWEGHEGGNSE
ncbi:hypothetical protein OG474_09800 [Kribbella sp. NBC_01505]|uniref:DUF7169 domain-containing protein n=1 Tax=Kribbella sp. NBC_01505 TaxID=2903580 RepID=UPI003865406D